MKRGKRKSFLVFLVLCFVVLAQGKPMMASEAESRSVTTFEVVIATGESLRFSFRGNNQVTLHGFYFDGVINPTLVVPETITYESNTYEVAAVGRMAFFYTSELERIELPDTVTTIEEKAFYNCKNLKSIKLPNRLETIGDEVFSNCSKLTGVVLPESLKNIGVWAFSSCKSLGQITVPAGVTALPYGVFEGCSNTKITIKSPNCTFEECALGDGKSITIYSEYNPNLNVYAKQYDIKLGVTSESYSVTFSGNGSNVKNVPKKQSVYRGAKVAVPSMPTRAGYEFAGWFYDKAGKKRFDPVKDTVSKNITLYAKWTKYSNKTVAYNRVFRATVKSSASRIEAEFFDKNGNYNCIYSTYNKGKSSYYLAIFDSKQKLKKTVAIKAEMPKFGNAIADSQGNIYICWGKELSDRSSKKTKNLIVTKYSSAGKKLSSISFAANSYGNIVATMNPFQSGNCSMAINKDGVLAVHFARQMFKFSDGLNHQSNATVYVNTKTMKRVNYDTPYASHSFSQQVIATKAGGFLFADMGDAAPRGFEVSQLYKNSGGNMVVSEKTTFHFTEANGTNYGMMYNYTFAELGGIAETDNYFVLVGNSEKKLSLDTYQRSSDRENVFIQIMKKDWENKSDEDIQALNTPLRKATGTRPSWAENMYLSKGTVDYGVLWLTDYTGDLKADQSKVFVNEKNQIVVMWNEYYKNRFQDSYYMILSETGSVLRGKTSMNKKELPESNDKILYKNGKVYWGEVSSNKIMLQVVDTAKTATRTGGYKGFKTIRGKTYYYDSKGYMKTGWVKVSGKYYYFNKDGVQVKNKTVKISGKNYKFDKKGVCTNRK